MEWPVWDYPVNPFFIEINHHDKIVRFAFAKQCWLVCDTCHDLMEKDRWGMLVNRALARFGAPEDIDLYKATMRIKDAFVEAKRGEPTHV